MTNGSMANGSVANGAMGAHRKVKSSVAPVGPAARARGKMLEGGITWPQAKVRKAPSGGGGGEGEGGGGEAGPAPKAGAEGPPGEPVELPTA